MAPRQVAGQQRNTTTRQGDAQQRAGFVGADIALNRYRQRFALHREMPQALAVVRMAQAVVQAQIVDLLRRRMLAQIGGRGAQHGAAHGQLACDQARVQLGAGANRQINALIHQVHRAVEHLQVNVDLGVAAHVLGHRTGQLRLTERGADADAQQPAWRRIGHADSGLQVLCQFQQLPAAGQGFVAGGGQAQLARGAVHQARPDPLFKFGQIP